jgi:hypothetical protein
MPLRKKLPHKVANIGKARKAKRSSRRPVLGFAPALQDSEVGLLHTFCDVHRGTHPKSAEPAMQSASTQTEDYLVEGSSSSAAPAGAQPPSVSCSVQTNAASCSSVLVDSGVQAVSDDERAQAFIINKLRDVMLCGFAPNSHDGQVLAAMLCSGVPAAHGLVAQTDKQQPRVTRAMIAQVLGSSVRRIERGLALLRSNPDTLLGQPQPVQKRQRVEPARHDLALHLLDSLAPIQSGRDWRVIRCTEDHLYMQYLGLLNDVAPGQKAVSKAYFINRVLDKKHNNVRHENNPALCPLCERKTVLEAKPEKSSEEMTELFDLQLHSLLKQIQWAEYHKIMSQLESNRDLRLIVQDFNKQEASSEVNIQVLTIVLYEASLGPLNRHYFHYLLPVGVSNDIKAVIACHRLFFQEPLIQSAKEHSFWNDGGPKHFKLTANLAHLWALAATNPRCVIKQHFSLRIVAVGLQTLQLRSSNTKL